MIKPYSDPCSFLQHVIPKRLQGLTLGTGRHQKTKQGFSPACSSHCRGGREQSGGQAEDEGEDGRVSRGRARAQAPGWGGRRGHQAERDEGRRGSLAEGQTRRPLRRPAGAWPRQGRERSLGYSRGGPPRQADE